MSKKLIKSMPSEQYLGEMKRLDPSKLIKKDDADDLDNFFLILGLIYNDWKSLNFYARRLEDDFTDVDTTEINHNSGEYHGMKDHLNRVMTSTMHEFLVFLEEKSKIINSNEFKLIIDKLNSDFKSLWQMIIDIADQNKLSKEGSQIRKILLIIRNNGSFHYYKSEKLLRKGFIDHFYTRHNQHASNKYALYSKGNTMRDCRYYYCDAAVQGFQHMLVQNKMEYNEYMKILLDFAEKMNYAIIALMQRYLASRR